MEGRMIGLWIVGIQGTCYWDIQGQPSEIRTRYLRGLCKLPLVALLTAARRSNKSRFPFISTPGLEPQNLNFHVSDDQVDRHPKEDIRQTGLKIAKGIPSTFSYAQKPKTLSLLLSLIILDFIIFEFLLISGRHRCCLHENLPRVVQLLCSFSFLNFADLGFSSTYEASGSMQSSNEGIKKTWVSLQIQQQQIPLF